VEQQAVPLQITEMEEPCNTLTSAKQD
jgi:hypothetical protein